MIKKPYLLFLSLVLLSMALFTNACGDDTAAKSSYGIFVTAKTTAGNIGGKSGADAMCNNLSDANHPNNGSTFKALISSNDRNLTTDWVLKANTEYTRFDIDSTVIGTTDADATLPNDTIAFSSDGNNAWTGLTSGFTAAGTCGHWTLDGSGFNGTYGETSQAGSVSWSKTIKSCDTPYSIICVEQ